MCTDTMRHGNSVTIHFVDKCSNHHPWYSKGTCYKHYYCAFYCAIMLSSHTPYKICMKCNNCGMIMIIIYFKGKR